MSYVVLVKIKYVIFAMLIHDIMTFQIFQCTGNLADRKESMPQIICGQAIFDMTAPINIYPPNMLRNNISDIFAKKIKNELKMLALKYQNIHIAQIDLLDFPTYCGLISQVSSVVGDDGLNVLINNAAVAPKSTRIHLTEAKDIIKTFMTNAVAPIMLAKACLPLLKTASKRNKTKQNGIERALIVNMSSILGSIEANEDGGMYAYRTSKAALNAATKSLSLDLKRYEILCVSMHPGWVKTDMGGFNAKLDVETSCNAMVKTMTNLSALHNGGFYQYDGERLPW